MKNKELMGVPKSESINLFGSPWQPIFIDIYLFFANLNYNNLTLFFVDLAALC